MSEDRPRVPPQLFRSTLKPQARDQEAVGATFGRARIDCSRYLAERHIALTVERDARFASRYRVDARGNVLFPHADPATGQVVGFEIKNRGFTGFATGGRKTYWMSDARLV